MRSRDLAIACALIALPTAQVAAEGIQDRTELPLTVRGGRPLLDRVYINGRGPFRFLLDTGSTVNVFSSKVIESAGLSATFQTDLRSATGSKAVSGGGGVSINIGTLVADDQPFVIGDMLAVQQLSPGTQGVLGQAFLARFDYLIDLRRGRLEVGAPRERQNGTRTPFRFVGGRPAIETSLGWMVVDSGADLPVIFGVNPRDHLVTGTNRQMLTATGPLAVLLVSLAPLFIEGERFAMGDVVALPASTEFGASGLLPTSVFSAVYISNSEGYLVLFR